MEELNYEIYSGGKLIAAFLYKKDRDDCADYLQESYNDCKFIIRDKNS